MNNLFWMILGALQVLVVTGAYAWLKHQGKQVTWWQMVLLYCGFASFCLVVAGGFTLMGEYERTAGWYFIGFLGVPVIIVMAILVRLFVFRKTALSR